MWVAKDSTAPATLTAADLTVSVSSPQGARDGFIASRRRRHGDGDVRRTDRSERRPRVLHATGERVLPSLVYYNVVTYELVVGTTIPATDGLLDLTIGPVSDVVGNAQSTGFQTTTFGADGKTVTIQSVRSSLALYRMSDGWFDDFDCVTSTNNPLDDGVAGPTHTFTLTLKAEDAAGGGVGDCGGRVVARRLARASPSPSSNNPDPTADRHRRHRDGDANRARGRRRVRGRRDHQLEPGADDDDGLPVWIRAMFDRVRSEPVPRRDSGRRQRRRDGDLVGAQGARRPHPADHHLAVARVGDQPGDGPVVRDSESAKVRFVRASPRRPAEPSECSTRHRRLLGGDHLLG